MDNNSSNNSHEEDFELVDKHDDTHSEGSADNNNNNADNANTNSKTDDINTNSKTDDINTDNKTNNNNNNNNNDDSSNDTNKSNKNKNNSDNNDNKNKSKNNNDNSANEAVTEVASSSVNKAEAAIAAAKKAEAEASAAVKQAEATVKPTPKPAQPQPQPQAQTQAQTAPASKKNSNASKQQQQQQQPAAGEPLVPQLLNLRDTLPYHIGNILYFDHPVCSGSVLALILGVYWLFTCKCCFSLLYVFANVSMWTLIGLVTATALHQLFERYVRHNPQPDNLVTAIIAPRLSCLCCPAGVCLSKETMQQHVSAIYDHVACALSLLKRAFLCENLALSVKTIGVLFALRVVGSIFSGAGLFLCIVLLAFSVPAAYQRLHVQIDAKLRPVVARVADVATNVMSKLPGQRAKAE